MGPEPVPFLDMPDWLAGMQAILAGATGVALADLQELQALANAVNARGGTVNCAWIAEAVILRLTGKKPDAVAAVDSDGSEPKDIQKRHNMTFAASSFQAAFDEVKAKGPGTIGLVAISYPPRPDAPAAPRVGHVVALVNHNGTVGLIEGQTPGASMPRQVITDPAVAVKRYNPNSQIDFGIVGAGAPARR